MGVKNIFRVTGEWVFWRGVKKGGGCSVVLPLITGMEYGCRTSLDVCTPIVDGVARLAERRPGRLGIPARFSVVTYMN